VNECKPLSFMCVLEEMMCVSSQVNYLRERYSPPTMPALLRRASGDAAADWLLVQGDSAPDPNLPLPRPIPAPATATAATTATATAPTATATAADLSAAFTPRRPRLAPHPHITPVGAFVRHATGAYTRSAQLEPCLTHKNTLHTLNTPLTPAT